MARMIVPDRMKVEEVLGERIRFACYQELLEREWAGLANSVQVESSHHVAFRMKSLVLRFTAECIALVKKGHRIDIDEEWPADWWQAFKARWFPAWALRRWPVKMREVHVHEQIYGPLCPHVAIADPKEHLQFLFLDTQRTEGSDDKEGEGERKREADAEADDEAPVEADRGP